MPVLVSRLEAEFPSSESDFGHPSALALEQPSAEPPPEGNLEMVFVEVTLPLACLLYRQSHQHHYLGLDTFFQWVEPSRKSALIG